VQLCAYVVARYSSPLACAVYANSFLASLNSRNSLRRHDFQVHSRNDGTSVRFNAINLSSIECDSHAGVKTIPDNDLGLLEVCSHVAFSLYYD